MRPLTVLHDTNGSNSDKEENSHDNVALFEKSHSLHTSGLLVVFACQGTVISNASSRLVEIDYPFTDTIWLRTVPCWCAQDMRQSGFVSRECHFFGLDDGGKKIVEVLSLDNFFLGNVVSIPTSAMHYVDVYLEADNGKVVEEFDGQHKLSPFLFAPAANFLTVTIPAMLVDPCVWDPGKRFKFRALTSYTVYNVKELL
ncbi:hypothetical protein H5410_009179 [Solanum commersonii]|uniref:Uncharacterized protein n=1 Tax=Solanum commersonii TaxID=4109 RepID=A0A9J6AHQ0_SOLCO|nr:hypothetical protein H5410_009179 [Solanum commersonii]